MTAFIAGHRSSSTTGGSAANRSVELHISHCASPELRREHKAPIKRVRTALQWLADNVPLPHPLVEKELAVTPNQQVYIVHEGRRIDISAGAQWPLDAVIRNLLTRKTEEGSTTKPFEVVLNWPAMLAKSSAR